MSFEALVADEALTVECLHCRGQMRRGTVPFTLERRGYHLTWDAVPAWVCTQCGEPLFEADAVALMQEALTAVDHQTQALANAGSSTPDVR